MPLPDADDPLTSNLYSQLRSSQLESVTSDDFDQVKDPVYVNSSFEDEARRIKLWGEIAGKVSSSGPMPGTMVVKSVTGNGDLFAPDAGQVWQLMGLAVGAYAASGINIRFNDGTSTMLLATASGAGLITTVPDLPVYVSSPGSIDVVVQSSSGSNTVQGAFIRVR